MSKYYVKSMPYLFNNLQKIVFMHSFDKISWGNTNKIDKSSRGSFVSRKHIEIFLKTNILEIS